MTPEQGRAVEGAEPLAGGRGLAGDPGPSVLEQPEHQEAVGATPRP